MPTSFMFCSLFIRINEHFMRFIIDKKRLMHEMLKYMWIYNICKYVFVYLVICVYT